MMRVMVKLIVVAVAFALSAGAAAAQVRLSLAGGPSFPLGALADEFDAGWHAQLSADLSMGELPFGLRVDGALNRFPETGGNFQAISGSVNGLVSLPVPLVSPYLIGGLGAYNSRVAHDEEDDDDDHDHGEEGSTTNLGGNIGVGLRLGLPGLSVFAEARLHNIFSEGRQVRFAPLSLGIRF